MEETTIQNTTFPTPNDHDKLKENQSIQLESPPSQKLPLTSNKQIMSPETPSLSENFSKPPTLLDQNVKKIPKKVKNQDTINFSKYSEDSDQISKQNSKNQFLQGKIWNLI